MAELKKLCKTRSSIKAKLTHFTNFINIIKSYKILSLPHKIELKNRLKVIDDAYEDFNKLQTEIELLSDDSEKEFAEREQFENLYYENSAYARSVLENPLTVDDQAEPGSSAKHDFFRLPDINPPSFDGDFQHWLEFRDMYISLIHNNDRINEISKFHYLRASLKGSASSVIQSLEFTACNYKIAWQLLTERYDNNKILITNHIQALFNVEQVQKDSSKSLRNLIDVTNKNLRALSALGQPTDQWDILIIFMMAKKLDFLSNRQWEEYKNTLTEQPTLKQFCIFLNNRAELLETLHSNKTINKNTNTDTITQKSRSFAIVTENTNRKPMCPLCKQEHYLFNCQTFRTLDVDTRNTKVASWNNVCKNCLRTGHQSKQCRLTHCKYCNLKHNTLLHKDLDKGKSNNVENVVLSTNAYHLSSSPAKASHVLLSTALVEVVGRDGRVHNARVLLDNGSTSNFVTSELCEKLGLPRRVTSSTIIGINSQVSSSTYSCSLTLQSRHTNYKTNITCYILPQITSSLPSTFIYREHIPIPNGLQLADPSFNIPATIDILVGAEVFWNILEANSISLRKNYPVLRESKLGWIMSGSILQNPTSRNTNHCHNINHCNFSDSIESQLSKFWDLDSISPTHSMSKDEYKCESIFKNTTKRDNDGRFVVKIPLKDSPDTLGDSYNMSKRRFLSLERKLQNDEKTKQQYHHFMQEYINLNHMTQNSDSFSSKLTSGKSQSQVNNFLPHHGVMRESSTTTKLRVVFDASATTSSNVSFNDIQLVGPTLQDDLISILLRFRQHKYVVTSDIEKMYRAVMLDPSQRSLQQIIFRFTPLEPLHTYTLNTLTYGTASAPYLATRCLLALAEECTDPQTKRAIAHDFYVDDFLSGGSSVESVTELCTNVIQALDSAKFNLRKWQSNNPEILKNILELKDDKDKALNLSDSMPSKTLGLYWNSESDNLFFEFQPNKDSLITKRIILSTISQIFDPIGLVGPCIVEAKAILQKLWKLKSDWDDAVPTELQMQYSNLITLLPLLKTIKIPRWVLGDDAVTVEIHTFTDASERAYGACCYIKTITRDGKVCIHLMASKNKIAPLKSSTIPRLELCGALIGTRLYKKIIKSLTIQLDKSYFWTDSTVILGWLSAPSSRLKTFVRNRVNEIHENTNNQVWCYVPSKENPADLVSRGVRADTLSVSSLWWTGPSFLHSLNVSYPTVNPETLPETNDNILPEMSFVSDVSENVINNLISKMSNFSKLVRVLAYVKRFINNLKHNEISNNLHLTCKEILSAENLLLKCSQRDMFPEEYHILKSGQSLPSKNRLLSLSPFIDSDDVIRVGGRLDNSFYTYDIKHPILLCSKHKLTKLIMEKQHLISLHAGPLLLLSQIRQKYWPLGGRNLAKQVVNSCVRCVRQKAKTTQPIMGNLPKDRLHLEYPFLNTGVDYAGPVMILNRKGRGSRLIKSYICVFVCFAVKALHLELVSDLTKECFLGALDRFIARRGKPQTIYCDNGTTFKTKWKSSSGKLRSGAMVIIKDKAAPPMMWQLGRIVRLIPGNDGIARVADVQTSKGIIRRAYNNICLLPVDAVEEEASSTAGCMVAPHAFSASQDGGGTSGGYNI
ncbi:uncharacterized protein LOC114360986 isoform X2 [Ostrinia furnacalis]|uniref:uncharacterized protein LOC114360986 isoform X2 n=1 Tax=Ostrinia furnacalis TaxID=93504 RepID=UPI00103ECF3A|nr:uncharacterized protein LOC114360986 isoform X2 [Ostrinia furnacalis]